MKQIFRYSLLSLTVLTLGFKSGAPALAEAKVLLKPEALTVVGTRGTDALETRILTVRSTAPVTNLRIYAFDLYNTNRERVFPKGLITVPETIDQVNVDRLQNFPVNFKLQQAPSGEFQGDILLSYQGNEVLVPVTVRIKDPWYLPFAVLVFGVILGTTVSSYSRWGRTTDEITVDLESLRTQFESDREIPASFASRISTHLVDAKLARDTKQIEAARQSITEARNVWGRWFRQREEWLVVCKLGTDLEKKLADLPRQELHTRYIQAIQRDLKDTLSRVVNFANPKELAENIMRLYQHYLNYIQVTHQLIDFQQLLDGFKPSQLEPTARDTLQNLQDKATNLKQQLSNLLPSEQLIQPELQVIQEEIVAATITFQELKHKIEESLGFDKVGEFKPGQDKFVGVNTSVSPTVAVGETPAPSVNEASSFLAEENPILKVITALIPNPNQRLQLFSFIGYLTTIAFLAGTGFNQLYLEQSTFGANGLRDYFAILAWGFGAEATCSAVTNALRKTDESKP